MTLLLIAPSAPAQDDGAGILGENVLVDCTQLEGASVDCEFRLVQPEQVTELRATLDGRPLPAPELFAFPQPGAVSAVLFLIDISDPGRAPAVAAGVEHIRRMLRAAAPHHLFGLATFDARLQVRVALGAGPTAVAQALDGVRAEGLTTELYRNTLAAVTLLGEYPADRRALIILSDGQAEDRAYFHRDVVEAARRHRVSIDGLGYPRSVGLSVALQTLRRMAEETDGRFVEGNTAFQLTDDYLDAPFAALDSGGTLAIDLQSALDAGAAGDATLRLAWQLATGRAVAELALRLPEPPPPIPELPAPAAAIASGVDTAATASIEARAGGGGDATTTPAPGGTGAAAPLTAPAPGSTAAASPAASAPAPGSTAAASPAASAPTSSSGVAEPPATQTPASTGSAPPPTASAPGSSVAAAPPTAQPPGSTSASGRASSPPAISGATPLATPAAAARGSAPGAPQVHIPLVDTRIPLTDLLTYVLALAGLVTIIVLIALLRMLRRRSAGSTQDAAVPAPASVRDAPPGTPIDIGPTFAFLDALDGSGERYAITSAAFRIGRHTDNELPLDDPSISRHHAQIQRKRDGSFSVTDLESMNGVFVNDERVSSAPIKEGDLVELGDVRMRFSLMAREELGGDDTVMLRTALPGSRNLSDRGAA